MTKNELKTLMYKYYILECELEDTLRFVHDLLIQKMEILERTEPYAKAAIKALYDAAREVKDLEYDVDEIMEGSYE